MDILPWKADLVNASAVDRVVRSDQRPGDDLWRCPTTSCVVTSMPMRPSALGTQGSCSNTYRRRACSRVPHGPCCRRIAKLMQVDVAFDKSRHIDANTGILSRVLTPSGVAAAPERFGTDCGAVRSGLQSIVWSIGVAETAGFQSRNRTR